MNTTPPPTPEALRLADWLQSRAESIEQVKAADLLRTQHERIAALEAENARLTNALHAIDTAAVFLPTFEVKHEGGVEAAAQGFRDGQAAQQAQPNEWYEALEFAARHLSSDWPEECQQIVRKARKALREQPAPQEQGK